MEKLITTKKMRKNQAEYFRWVKIREYGFRIFGIFKVLRDGCTYYVIRRFIGNPEWQYIQVYNTKKEAMQQLYELTIGDLRISNLFTKSDIDKLIFRGFTLLRIRGKNIEQLQKNTIEHNCWRVLCENESRHSAVDKLLELLEDSFTIEV